MSDGMRTCKVVWRKGHPRPYHCVPHAGMDYILHTDDECVDMVESVVSDDVMELTVDALHQNMRVLNMASCYDAVKLVLDKLGMSVRP